MKKWMMGLLGLFLIAGLTGCDDLSDISCESSTKVEVTVLPEAQMFGTGYDKTGQSFEGYYPNIQVRFDYSKTDGKSFTSFGTTNGKGEAKPSMQVGYNLRKGQQITVTATVMGLGEPTSETEILTYERAKPYNADKGVTEKYTWEPFFILRVPPLDPDLYPAPTPKE